MAHSTGRGWRAQSITSGAGAAWGFGANNQFAIPAPAMLPTKLDMKPPLLLDCCTAACCTTVVRLIVSLRAGAGAPATAPRYTGR